MTPEIQKLEEKRATMHEYLLMKLSERDYHAIADAAMDLREIQVKVDMLRKKRDDNSSTDV